MNLELFKTYSAEVQGWRNAIGARFTFGVPAALMFGSSTNHRYFMSEMYYV